MSPSYSIKGRMSMDSGSRMGEWYLLKSGVPEEEVKDKFWYYRKFWRFIEVSDESRGVKLPDDHFSNGEG